MAQDLVEQRMRERLGEAEAARQGRRGRGRRVRSAAAEVPGDAPKLRHLVLVTTQPAC
jgi:hypothetical protein